LLPFTSCRFYCEADWHDGSRSNEDDQTVLETHGPEVAPNLRPIVVDSLRCRIDIAASDFVFHQTDGAPWKSILESYRTLLKRCGLKRSGVHILRHTFGAHLAQKGVEMAVIRDLLGHHSVTLTEKYYAHLVPGNLSSAVEKLQSPGPFTKSLLPKTLPKMDFAPFPGTKMATRKCR